jgi:hypothetical protein
MRSCMISAHRQFCLQTRTSCCPDSQTPLGCMMSPVCAVHRPTSSLLQAHRAACCVVWVWVWLGG